MSIDQAANLTSTRTHGDTPYFRIFMPYLFQRVEYLRLKNVYLPLNRDYKPIGVRGYADYDAFIEIHGVRLPRAAERYADIWFNPQPETRRFWLYDDSSVSRLDYFDRLAVLLRKGLPLIDPDSPRARRLKMGAVGG